MSGGGNRLLMVLLGLLLAAAGVAMMVLGFSPAPEAPLPDLKISVVRGVRRLRWGGG